MYVRLPEQDIPKDELRKKLTEEGAAFLRSLMSMELPKLRGRLRLPVIETVNKKRAAQVNSNAFEDFCGEAIEPAPGCNLMLAEVKDEFLAFLSEEDRDEWRNRINYKLLDSLPTPISHKHTKNGRQLNDVRWSDSYATSA
jgi:hypothetical protein